MEKLDQAYWNQLYQQQETRWDIGYPSTPLKEYIDQLNDKNISILIPGCGNSYEAEYLLQNGFTDVTVVDISTMPTEAIRKKLAKYLGKELTVITGNFFDLKGQFDILLEQTFFCALSPLLRSDYVKQTHALLKPGGKLVGVMFNRDFEDGPPFGGSIGEYRPLFEEKFRIEKMEACYNSIQPRSGTEVFVKMIKKM